MSQSLAFANQSIYHGKILLTGWRYMIDGESEPREQVGLAFAPAVRRHFLDAYGWLLLAACRVNQVPEQPPHSVNDLPPLPAGLVRPAEVNACAALENDGLGSGPQTAHYSRVAIGCPRAPRIRCARF